MFIAILGFLILAGSVLQIRFPGLAGLLKESEPETWKKIGSPSGFSFSDLGNTLSLFSWILAEKFVDSENADVLEEGRRAFAKARRVKFGLILGVVTMVAGFAIALVRAFV
ncbi:hypothetical protein [Microbulbifer aggregans]|uniref:hypothetical protein n=1 Tax=Microbulbifer aggregans TaxID=1769779 RepID=UPI001CFED1B1|nr:hypothetical protein [Microbulbifer aggregans]